MIATLPQQIEIQVRSAPELGEACRLYRMICRHGTTTGAFLPGRRAVLHHQVIDLPVANHQAARACTCLPGGPIA